MPSPEVEVSSEVEFSSARATFVTAGAIPCVAYADLCAAEYMAVN